jgi:long-subunit acyl-CoA synthetase (AMP-forming)
VAQCAAGSKAFALVTQQRAIPWLPMAHIADRLCTHYVAMHLGWSVTCLADPRHIVELLPGVRPQFFFSPPRLWEKLRVAAPRETSRSRSSGSTTGLLSRPLPVRVHP